MEEVVNINELQNAFTEYIESVKPLSLFEKKQEVIDSIKELIISIEMMASNDGIELHYLTSKEILDINEDSMPEEDYVEAILVYVEVAKNMLGEYLLAKEERL
ncbi:MAG: hypothetical protein HFH46_01075 [Bacilli bacterium]|nr:hypothetical protein [Bacilli bacterium]MCI9585050.1 hypothetical protein [Bacilli bacterium]